MFTESFKGYGYVDSDIPELGIAVSKEVRGNGLGTLLMKEIIDHAINVEKYKAISLSVDPKNSNAVHIYRKLGFKNYALPGTSITMIYRAI